MACRFGGLFSSSRVPITARKSAVVYHVYPRTWICVAFSQGSGSCICTALFTPERQIWMRETKKNVLQPPFNLSCHCHCHEASIQSPVQSGKTFVKPRGDHRKEELFCVVIFHLHDQNHNEGDLWSPASVSGIIPADPSCFIWWTVVCSCSSLIVVAVFQPTTLISSIRRELTCSWWRFWLQGQI